MEYLVFLKLGLGLMGALSVSIYLWSKRGGNKIEKPIKTKDGDYLLNKPDEMDEAIKYDDIKEI
jgi:hypothetical protein